MPRQMKEILTPLVRSYILEKEPDFGAEDMQRVESSMASLINTSNKDDKRVTLAILDWSIAFVAFYKSKIDKIRIWNKYGITGMTASSFGGSLCLFLYSFSLSSLGIGFILLLLLTIGFTGFSFATKKIYQKELSKFLDNHPMPN